MLIVRDLQNPFIREIRLIRCGQFDTPSCTPKNRRRRCRLVDVVDVDQPMSSTSIQMLLNSLF